MSSVQQRAILGQELSRLKIEPFTLHWNLLSKVTIVDHDYFLSIARGVAAISFFGACGEKD